MDAEMVQDGGIRDADYDEHQIAQQEVELAWREHPFCKNLYLKE